MRRPSYDQFKLWNDHYQIHGMSTLLLIDFSGKIIACFTNIDGHVHDATSASYINEIPEVLDGTFALGDPGFGGISYIVAGLHSNQVVTEQDQQFDRVSRSEQLYLVMCVYWLWMVQ